MPNNAVAVGGREESRKLTHTHTRTHTHEERGRERGSSRDKEDGGRCGSGGADLHPAAAASLMEAGELAARRREAPLSVSADTSTAVQSWRSAPYITALCCCEGDGASSPLSLLTVLEGGGWLRKTERRVSEEMPYKDSDAQNRHTGCVHDALCRPEARPPTRDVMNETAHRGPVVGRCRVPAGLTICGLVGALSSFFPGYASGTSYDAKPKL